MTNRQGLSEHQRGLGDLAVDGLLGGLAGGMVMAGYLAAAGLAGGVGVAETLARFDPSGDLAVVGALAHLATASVYGAVFGSLAGLLRRLWRGLPVWLAGLAFGVVLLAVANGVFLPWMAPGLRAIPAWHFLIGHLLYGVTLGFSVGRR